MNKMPGNTGNAKTSNLVRSQMTKQAHSDAPVQRSRWASIVVIGLALVVLGGTLAWSALNLRARIRSQIVGRYGEILDAVTG